MTERALPALVYVLDCDHGTKVGITTQTIAQRVADLERGAGIHVTIVRTWTLPSRTRAYGVEQAAHWALRDTRTVGEWFHCHPLEAVDAVELVLRRGIPIEFYRREPVAA